MNNQFEEDEEMDNSYDEEHELNDEEVISQFWSFINENKLSNKFFDYLASNGEDVEAYKKRFKE